MKPMSLMNTLENIPAARVGWWLNFIRYYSRLGIVCALASILAGYSRADTLSGISLRDSSVSLPAGGNGDSVAPGISADGRYVLFSSSAINLTPGANSQFGLNVFLRDRASNATLLVSANCGGTGGGNGNSVSAMLSTNAQYVAFESDASDLLPGDTNEVSDIFVRDLQAGTNILASVAADGGFANGASTAPVMTPDGRWVAFISAATNLVAGDTNGIPDVFIRDLVAQTTTLVSVGANGSDSVMDTPVITPDGRRVAFFSTARGLAPGVSAFSSGEIYVRDLLANITIWASTNAAATVSSILLLSDMPSHHPALSADGNFVAFKTGWTNVSPPLGGRIAAALVFRYDINAGTNSFASANGIPSGAFPEDHVYGPEISADGRFVTYVATNLAPISSTSVQLWDAQSGTNVVVSITQSGDMPTNTFSDNPFISPDGRFVIFLSSATNLVANAVSNGSHIYIRDLQTGLTQLIDVDTNGIGSTDNLGAALGLSADGQFVVFDSSDGKLVKDDNNGSVDVFLRDVAGGSNELVSCRNTSVSPQTAGGLSFLSRFSLSDDGKWVAFSSCANDLVPNDTNRVSDVFVRNLIGGTNVLASTGINGRPAPGGSSYGPVISQNGRFVAFVCLATNSIAGQSNLLGNIFLRDLQSNTTVLVSVSTNGVSSGDGDASDPVLSQDGRYVAFLSKAKNLAPGITGAGPNTCLRDLSSGTTVSLTGNSSSAYAPSMSSDGHYVAYFDAAAQLFVWDTRLGANSYTNLGAKTSAAISPSGTRLLFTTTNAISAVDVINKTNIITVPTKVPIANASPWSADGRFFVFVTATNAASGDNNNTNDVYVCDLLAGTLSLVSLNSTLAGSANNYSDWPAINGDGRFVVYRSYATDIVSGNTNPPPNIFLFDRFSGSNRLLTAAAPGSIFSSWNSKPGINGDGRVVTFQSLNPNLVANDLNRVPDVIAASLSPWGTADTDEDGIPDLWMTHCFGHPTAQAGDQSRAQDDADGDGASNLQEYLAGTDPTDAASVFRAQITGTISPGNTVTLNWPAVPGKSYHLQSKTNLSESVWLDSGANLSIIGTQVYVTVPSDPPSRFYRVMGD
jgi:Tol biopolymer transport system component